MTFSRIPPEPAGAGSSAQTAVVVRSLWQEYLWIQKHGPGGIVVKRRDMYDGEKRLDVLTVETQGSEAQDVYFDVSACFSARAVTPPCPYCGERLATAKARQCAQCFADFHDPTNVVYRKGPGYVERVREMAAERRERDARPPGLNDPRAAFTTHFQPRRVTADEFALSFPDQLSDIDDRLFRIGIDCLIADGCRGVVCHVPQPLRSIGRLTTTGGNESAGAFLRLIIQLARCGLTVVLVGGDEINKLSRGWPAFESHETEARAIAGLTERLRQRQQNDGRTHEEP